MPDKLFTPLNMGRVTLPNRICFLAHRTNFARRGVLNDRHIAYYSRRARGECGLIVVGELSIHPGDRPWETMIEAYSPPVIKDFQKLTNAIHESETAVFAQLTHHGFQSSGAISRHEIWGPSAISDIAFGETSKAMEPEDMEEVVKAFANAAMLAREGGFDGLEIDIGPESLLRQFLSPISNHRQDEYGGSVENRMRLPLQVMDSVRKAVGTDFTVGICLCADEKFWGGIGIEDALQFAQGFENTGQADFINVSVGTYYNLHLILASMHTPMGFTIELAEQIKNSSDLPVIASYQIGFPGMAENVIAEGKADATGFVRALICDPDIVKKARKGDLEDIRYCVKDNKGCIGRINQSKMLGCIQNPCIGHEKDDIQDTGYTVQSSKFEIRNSKLETRKKRAIVVGTGPAGLQAAIIAKQKDIDVTVYEKEDVVGGQLNLIKKRAARQGMAGVVRYLTHCLKKLQVPVITGTPVTSELIREENPDAVIVATGSKPIPKPFPGNYGPPSVLNVWDVLKEEFPVGERVLFIDQNGGHHATATVEMLADQGKKVDMVTSDLFIGIELAPLGDLYLSRQRLLQKGVTFMTDVAVDEIEGAQVRARDIYTNERLLFEGYDTIILDVGNAAQDDLYQQLKGQVKELYRAGDCVAPRGIDMAIIEGQRVGESL